MTRVLIVDDHDGNRYLLRVLLEGHGLIVDEARHGAEALTTARANPPALVISDLLMPVMDGYALLSQWRSDERLKEIPFVVYTATYTDPRDERLALSLGASAFIIKPAEPDSFMARLREYLAQTTRRVVRAVPDGPTDTDGLLKDYNEALVRKLEKKCREAEEANRALLQEIAEHRRAAESLRESEERFRATFEHAAAGIAHVDVNGRLIRVNDRLCQLTGYPCDELLHVTLNELMAPEDQAEGDAARRAMLAGVQALYSSEKRYRRKTGDLFWGNLVTTLLRDCNGDPRYFISVITDVTEHKDLQEQLRQAQKMEAIGRLAGGVAHDFNNLLTIIDGCSQLLLDVQGLSDGDHELVKAIKDAGERAAALTRQLLGFSRKTILQPEFLDLNAIVVETGKMLRRLLGEDILLTTVLDESLGRAKVDPGQLSQVLMNLAINARDAMPSGGMLTIETSNVTLSHEYAASHLDCKAAGPHVMLAMTDTGCGIAPNVLGQIFDPFFTTKALDKGTGLGLSMVFGIVQQSDGAIHVYSEPGLGTTFKIYFPVVAAEPVTTTSELVAESAKRGTETIFLVEDEPGVRALVRKSLEMHGYTVLVATDGKDALQILDSQLGPVDLLLTDVVMPSMSGPELAAHIRSRFPRVKVLFMSGYTDDAVVRHGLLNAEASFIQKPYTPHELARKVRRVLDDDAGG